MGPVEAHLRVACERGSPALWIERAGTNPYARLVLYAAGDYLTGRLTGIAEIYFLGLVPDMFSEAICAAEALGL